MIQFPKHICPFEINKYLPKKYSHFRERLKLQLISEALSEYFLNDDFGEIDLDETVYCGKRWNIQYSKSVPKRPIGELVEAMMSQEIYFNFSKNENVYFYRFINVFRNYLGEELWKEVDKHLKNTKNEILRGNYSVYCDYREKLDEIELLVTEKNV